MFSMCSMHAASAPLTKHFQNKMIIANVLILVYFCKFQLFSITFYFTLSLCSKHAISAIAPVKHPQNKMTINNTLIFISKQLEFIAYDRLIIVDEMDYLITRDRSVLHDLFMLTTLPFSRCVLIGKNCGVLCFNGPKYIYIKNRNCVVSLSTQNMVIG
jgi:Cdc6-like AAA superfamily ATPase